MMAEAAKIGPATVAPVEAMNAVVEDVDLKAPRGLDKALFARLAAGDWIDQHQNLIVIGPTGVGKSWIACALAHKACRDDRSVLYHRACQGCSMPWRSHAVTAATPGCSIALLARRCWSKRAGLDQ